MTLFALTFFGLACALVCRLLPAGYRWVFLLAVSLIYYAKSSLFGLPVFLCAALVTWGSALRMSRIAEETKAAIRAGADKKAAKAESKKRRRAWLFLALAVDFGLLIVFKYTGQVMTLFGAENPGIVLPLGISFYTFMSVAYLLDVYNGKSTAEKSPLRFTGFLSFYPHLLQGPISRYDDLAPQLREPQTIDMAGLDSGFLLILWGLFKKMVVADRAAGAVSAVFDAAVPFGGAVNITGVLLYSLQQYCDFSGGIDLIMGIALLCGIRLAPNFKRPYFAVNLGDFWRRWHITLGSFMRDYVFYPFALTKPMSSLSKAVKAKLGPEAARALPAALGNLVVFFLVGLWHGATGSYIAWGLYNGIILAIAALLEHRFKLWNQNHEKLSRSAGWHVFRVLRTFVIVNIGWFFDRCATAGGALRMIGGLFTDFRGGELTMECLANFGLSSPDLIILLLSTALIFVVSLISERGTDVRGSLVRLPLPLRWALMLAAVVVIVLMGEWGSGYSASAFIYNMF